MTYGGFAATLDGQACLPLRFQQMGVDAGVVAFGELRAQQQRRVGTAVRVRRRGKDREASVSTVPKADGVLHEIAKLVDALRLEDFDSRYPVAQVARQRGARKNVAELPVEKAHPESSAHTALVPGGKDRVHVFGREPLAGKMVDGR